jgi:hypothetical protein
LLERAEITLSTCPNLSLASLLLGEKEQPEHSCEEVLMENDAVQPNLRDQPLYNPDLDLYINGSSFVRDEVRHAGFTVVTEWGTLQ